MFCSYRISTDKLSCGPSAIAEPLVNFWGPVHISGVAEATAVKFGTQVGYIKSYEKNKKNHPQKGRVYGHVTYLTSYSPLQYLWNGYS